MAEVDVNKIEDGQTAEITLDAVPDATLTGTVTQIAPAGVQSSGVVNYPVTVALTESTDSRQDRHDRQRQHHHRTTRQRADRAQPGRDAPWAGRRW